MKKTITLSIVFLFYTLCIISDSNAQLTGIKNIPGDYPALTEAVTDLNAQGVGTGGVIINLISGNPQTAPAGGSAFLQREQY